MNSLSEDRRECEDMKERRAIARGAALLDFSLVKKRDKKEMTQRKKNSTKIKIKRSKTESMECEFFGCEDRRRGCEDARKNI